MHSDSSVTYPETCVHRWFEIRAALSGESTAAVYDATHLSYDALNRRANRLAHYLQAHGAGPEVPVALYAGRDLDMLISLLAILKAGSPYVPLDAGYPPPRLAFILEDCGVPLLLNTTQAEVAVPAGVTVLRPQAEDLPVETHNPVTTVTPDNLAYIIYTSGSTGRPKGVAMPHRALVNLLHWQLQNFTTPPAVDTAQFASLSFDVSFQEIFSTWLAGGTLHVISTTMRQDITQLAEYLKQAGIVRLFLPVVALQQLAEVAHRDETSAFDSLREIITAGESLRITPAIIRLFRHLPDATLHNHYGPSETHVVSSYTLHGDPAAWPPLPPIGTAIANTRLWVLDEQQQAVPPGSEGELYISGAPLARGYVNHPELTAERFVQLSVSSEPLSGEESGKKSPNTDNTSLLTAYKTGDRVRQLPDGNLEFIGRMDHQVKIRGFRVELAEIEACLLDHPTVREVAVVLREDTPGQLAAYIVPEQEDVLRAETLRDFLRARLPDYMLPASFSFLAKMPLTVGGKLDRQSLPVPEDKTTGDPPRTPLETTLAGIWQQAFGCPAIGIHDNFFTLGGHSLLAGSISAAVRTALQVDLPLAELFEHPTIADLAERIEAGNLSPPFEKGGPGGISQAASFEKGRQGAIYQNRQPPVEKSPPAPLFQRGESALDISSPSAPLSFGQTLIWTQMQLDPDAPVYNEHPCIRLGALEDIGAFEKAFNSVIRRHDALRTTFRQINGEPVQIVSPELHVTLPLIDLSALPADCREAEAFSRAEAIACRPLDTSEAPLFRSLLVKLTDSDYRFFLIIHHLIFDGVSLYSILLPELQALYRRQSAGMPGLPSGLQEEEVPQYPDFARWQQQTFSAAYLQPQVRYWQQQLAKLEPLDLPVDKPRQARLSSRGARHCLQLPADLVQKLKKLSAANGVTLFMTLLAAFKVLLFRYSGHEDIAVGSVVSNRPDAESGHIFGCFLNTLVLRTRLAADMDFSDLLGKVRKTVQDAHAHREVPFEQVVKAVNPVRSANRQPLFDAAFIFQPPYPVLETGWQVAYYDIHPGAVKFDLTLDLEVHDDKVYGAWEYRSDLFEEATIARMTGHYQTLLEGAATNPTCLITELPLLTAAEWQQLNAWNHTHADFPDDTCIHHLIEARVLQQPDACALRFAGQEISYDELNRRANQIAHYLIDQGVGAGILVALSLERSPEMIISLLGILKAGGVYVPLDPTYPKQRLAFMLEDCGARVLVTREPLLAYLPANNTLSVCLDRDQVGIEACSPENPSPRTRPENPAYVIYTSGTTGKPKGVVVGHRGLCNLAIAQIQYFGINAKSVVLQYASLNFDASISEISTSLIVGATLCLATQENLFPGPALLKFIRNQAITVLTMPPSALAALPFGLLPALQTLVVAGEACPPELAARWAHNRCFINAYGPTEITICAAMGEYQPGGRISVIGKPIANIQIFILDKYRQPVPAGIPGELYIGGIGLAQGYLNRPDLNGEKFIQLSLHKPLVSTKSATAVMTQYRSVMSVYKSGDLGRWLPDGTIEFLGRRDQQVKIRGFRVEIQEIEALLEQHPVIQEVTVIAVPGCGKQQILVACLVMKADLMPNRLSLQTTCLAVVKDYPPVWLTADSLSANGLCLNGVPPYCRPGQTVSVNLSLPESTGPFHMQGSITWTDSCQAGIHFTGGEPGMEQYRLALRGVLKNQGVTYALQSGISRHLHNFLNEKLPDYMLPARYEFIPALPLTPNGKIDRQALENQVKISPLRNKENISTLHNPLEKALATLWSELLDIPSPDVRQSFFALGGHSLMLVQMQQRLEALFSRPIPISVLFQYTTIRDLSNYLSSQISVPRSPQTVAARYPVEQVRRRAERQRQVRKKLVTVSLSSV